MCMPAVLLLLKYIFLGLCHGKVSLLLSLDVDSPPPSSNPARLSLSFLSTRPWWFLQRVQRVEYDSNYSVNPTWQLRPDPCKSVLCNTLGIKSPPSSPGPTSLMAVKSSFLSVSLAASISLAPTFLPFFASYETCFETTVLFIFSKHHPHFLQTNNMFSSLIHIGSKHL